MFVWQIVRHLKATIQREQKHNYLDFGSRFAQVRRSSPRWTRRFLRNSISRIYRRRWRSLRRRIQPSKRAECELQLRSVFGHIQRGSILVRTQRILNSRQSEHTQLDLLASARVSISSWNIHAPRQRQRDLWPSTRQTSDSSTNRIFNSAVITSASSVKGD